MEKGYPIPMPIFYLEALLELKKNENTRRL